MVIEFIGPSDPRHPLNMEDVHTYVSDDLGLSNKELRGNIFRMARAILQPGYSFLDANRATYGESATEELREMDSYDRVITYTSVVCAEILKLTFWGALVHECLPNLLT